MVLLVCGALIGCGGLYGAERAKGGKVSCDRAGFEAGTPEHRECMLRYIEAFMNRVGVRGDDLRYHRQRHDLQLTTGGYAMSEFRTVTNTADLAPGKMKLVDLDGEEIAIANVDGEYFAFNNTCPHKGGPLAEGELEGDIVTCPWHATPFNVRTGEAQEGGVTDDPVATYEVRLEGDDIQIRKA